CIQSLEFPLTF
nr:immunoglobulin light chain junction region [Macaca mulatta]MOV83133.1 immunoglobulin light chain junction region [Macaca mulatta]MOW55037.1 immunoglobulin light chain junction region [Macaca mulatta]MOW55625.1 immunoglobulin light chain junction region [Macaca mulatta]MOW56283.1 immunoglobulin light chain junction region [Macaca mulatta]